MVSTEPDVKIGEISQHGFSRCKRIRGGDTHRLFEETNTIPVIGVSRADKRVCRRASKCTCSYERDKPKHLWTP